MAILDLFPSRIRFVDANGVLTPEAVRALGDVFNRIGGSAGPSTVDLSQSDDDDSGLEEFKHESSKAMQGFGSLPPTVFDAYVDPLNPIPAEHPQYVDPLYPIHQEHARSVEELETEISSLRERIASLEAEINNIRQGTGL